jgi:aminoglycoside phosphotransferase (APT) family kinase protein
MNNETDRAEVPTPGLDQIPVTNWLESAELGLRPPLRFRRVGLGRSNLTYIVEDVEGRSAVLRRPPGGKLLESAHDVAREHRFLTILSAAGQPVPRPMALCEDIGITGAPFYVMEHVAGIVADNVEVVDRDLSLEARSSTGPSLARTLARMQTVDVVTSGLGSLVKTGGADHAARQIRRWNRQWAQSKPRDLPLIDEIGERLLKQVPVQTGVTVVHGDYTLYNSIVDDQGSVCAVLDWEMATVGDPQADLAWLLILWAEDPSQVMAGPKPVTLMPGFGSRAEIIDAYVAESGYEPPDLPFWVTLSYWKLAVAIAGVYQRWQQDPGNVGDGAERFGVEVERIAEQAAAAADQAGI